MNRDNTEHLGDVIKRLLKAYRLNDKYYQVAILEEWKTLMGPLIAKQTHSVFYRDGKLVIRINSAPLRQELGYGKEKILTSLNKALGERVIKEVEIR